MVESVGFLWQEIIPIRPARPSLHLPADRERSAIDGDFVEYPFPIPEPEIR